MGTPQTDRKKSMHRTAESSRWIMQYTSICQGLHLSSGRHESYLSGTADNSDTAKGISLIAAGDMVQEPYIWQHPGHSTHSSQDSQRWRVYEKLQMMYAWFLWGSSGRRGRRKMKGSLTAMRVACRQCSNGLWALVLSENRQEEIPSSHNPHILTINETSHILTKILRRLWRGISRNIWKSGKLWWTVVVYNVT